MSRIALIGIDKASAVCLTLAASVLFMAIMATTVPFPDRG